jgi:hypothetical protein
MCYKRRLGRKAKSYSWLGVILVVGGMTSCGSEVGNASKQINRLTPKNTVTTTAPPSTTSPTSIETPQFAAITRLGGTIDFTASVSVSAKPTGAARITLVRVIEPPLSDLQRVPPTGDRDVELKVMVANVGLDTIPGADAGDEHILSIAWTLDPQITNSGGTPLYRSAGNPNASCPGVPTGYPKDIAPGKTASGCIMFYDVPDDTAVTSISALLLYGGNLAGLPSEWVIS